MIKEHQKLLFAAKQLGYRSLKRYQSRSNFVFRNIPLRGKLVLDVGCGRGDFSLWAGLQGADYVLGIEPEEAGCTHGVLQIFRHLIDTLDLGHAVEASHQNLKEISPERQFDIIILYNVINHLDEEAVCVLHENPVAFARYLSLAHQLRRLLQAGGVLILADCRRKNAWHHLGVPPPLARNISWEKHQEPEIWIKLFNQAAFSLRDLRWSPLYPFGALSSNRLVQYLTTSHFVLRFEAQI
jgi:SAM-dependent methyltransferase